ncbi:Uncharacterised protein [Citrobacter koseri]|uniref:Uncharacterized protein n=1 Tax=Citrobacter koseri TaxID=545 RepID=A0A2X2VGP5_CITKO|nr:Uncharacterised protein [Citrobacter koseri]
MLGLVHYMIFVLVFRFSFPKIERANPFHFYSYLDNPPHHCNINLLSSKCSAL